MSKLILFLYDMSANLGDHKWLKEDSGNLSDFTLYLHRQIV